MGEIMFTVLIFDLVLACRMVMYREYRDIFHRDNPQFEVYVFDNTYYLIKALVTIIYLIIQLA